RELLQQSGSSGGLGGGIAEARVALCCAVMPEKTAGSESQPGPSVVVVVVVVEVVGVMTTATRSATQSSASACTLGEAVGLWQSFGFFASSFAKQPFAGSSPPVYFATALSTQPFVFGSVGFPGVWASWRHLSSAARYLAMQPVLPARHLACWGDAGAAGKSSSTVTSAGPSERFGMSPPTLQRSQRWKTARRMRRAGPTRPPLQHLCQRTLLTLALRKAAPAAVPPPWPVSALRRARPNPRALRSRLSRGTRRA